MKKEFKIFYSWQSDLDAKTNKYFIRDLIEKAAKKINKEIDNPMPFDLRIDSDTIGVSGSPNIVDKIFEKITNCSVFIADVSIINSESSANLRKTPNPNVMIELGYAVKNTRLG